MLFGGVALAWAIGAGAGFFQLLRYAATPGPLTAPPGRWPEASGLRADPSRFNLIMLAHPRCPCTRASLAELDRLMARCRGRVAAHVLFLRPSHAPAGWERTGLWRAAAAIPGARVLADPGGVEAGRYGAMTSGHVLLYDRSGGLLFSGGITGARGHEGENAGSRAVVGLVLGREGRSGADVFGCPLFGAGERARSGRLACRR
jgi:hypothetical protein